MIRSRFEPEALQAIFRGTATKVFDLE